MINKYVHMEAGGGSSLGSAIYLMDLIHKGIIGKYDEIIFCDQNNTVLEGWSNHFPHSYTVLEKDLDSKNNSDYIYLPVDEYNRIRLEKEHKINKFACEFNHDKFTISNVHNKSDCYNILYYGGAKNYLPQRFSYQDIIRCKDNNKFVSRLNISAGCKGLSIIEPMMDKQESKFLYDSDKYIFTEFIDFDEEYVCDFVRRDDDLVIFPRITKNLKHGADTDVVVINWRSDKYRQIHEFIQTILNIFEYSGIGMIQFGIKDDKIYFIEMGCRLSGSSFVNYDLFKFNPYEYWITGTCKYEVPEVDTWYSMKLCRILE